MLRYKFNKVFIQKSVIDRKDWVKYLVVVDWNARDFENILTRTPDEAFGAFVDNHVKAYLDGKAPPAAIQSAVLNIVDDYASGREVVLKTGDYIALQTMFMQHHKTQSA